ncbi:DUF6327 family protein [Flavobacterium cheonhonense]|uniref:DUF6327 family protein n=2 Tax=Flavobacterium cheonhonense TaxID=706185 RepID=A0ABP7U0U8_9FLAO|nr:DUF6327 family protein [Flavobacterium cheonhonense]
MMETKKYASYAEIEHDLEILKLEKEIYFQKMKLSYEKTKDSIFPSEPVQGFYAVYKKLFSGTLGSILKIALPYVIGWFINRKRGD